MPLGNRLAEARWANVEVAVDRKRPEKNEMRLIPLSNISTITLDADETWALVLENEGEKTSARS